MMPDKQPEVLVAGAGPVGLFAALTLAQKGIGVKVVDTGVWACQHSYALALHPQTVALFREAGLQDRILDGAYPVTGMALWNREAQQARIALDGDEAAGCMLVLRQDVLEEVLEEALHGLGVKVQWRHELAELTQDAAGLRARVDKYERESRGYIVAHTEWVVTRSVTLTPAFVIGADGTNSVVRRSLGIDFPEVGNAEYFAVFEFESDFDGGFDVRVVLGDRTTDVLWPMPHGVVRWSFQLPDYVDQVAERLKVFMATERAKDRILMSEGAQAPVLDESSLRGYIAERAPWFQGSIGKISWRMLVRFEKRRAAEFGKGRVWLAGDAAHLTGPVGIQSMNVGLFEAHDLCGRVEQVLRKGAPVESAAEYGKKWRTEWEVLHGELKAAGAGAWLAPHAGRLMSCLPGHGEGLEKLAGQVGLSR
jgi:pentachlorophenol monooxygenase